MLIIIDNYDSFTYNLVQYFGELGEIVEVFSNDKVTISELEKMNCSGICISPGPCTPKEAGISCQVIQEFGGKIPILGVCLGHQAIAQVFGGNIIRAERLLHGKTSEIFHDESNIFAELPNPFIATRYHSLIVERQSLPSCLKISAWTKDEEIMGIHHKNLPIYGVQFHPESILTTHGKKLLKNYLDILLSYAKI